MQKRGARLAVVALLVAIGGAAAFLSWDIDRRARTLHDVQRDMTQRTDAIAAALADIALSQHGYVALGSSPAPSGALVASRIEQVLREIEQLEAQATSADAARALQALTSETTQLMAADARAQAYARTGQTFLASDLLAGRVREHLTAAAARLRDVRAAEAASAASRRGLLRGEALTLAGATGAVWVLGLLWLAWTGGRSATGGTGTVAPERVEGPVVPTAAAERPDGGRTTSPVSVDLAGAATLCRDLSRVTTTAALPSLLARAAGILDARGLVVWMGAGDQLFAAAAHGYEARLVSRLAPIGRNAVNATATAWRTGRIGTVGGDGTSDGAIVAPMFGPTDCIGVLAAEVRHGREHDAATRAVTGMIAAQLASIVAAWPAASTGGPDASALDRAAG